MEKHQRWFRFYISSSAEAITAFGIENMVRLGVVMVWIGFESPNTEQLFAKNTGIDAARLVRELRDHGISVLGSAIMCMEHHTPDNIANDIEYVVGLNTDLLPVHAVHRHARDAAVRGSQGARPAERRSCRSRNGTGRT